MVEEPYGPLDRLGKSREVLKTILGFGAVVAEVGLSICYTVDNKRVYNLYTATPNCQACDWVVHGGLGGALSSAIPVGNSF